MSITGKLLFIASSPHIGCLVHSIRDNQLLIQVEGSFNNSSMFFLSMQRTFIQSMYLTSMSKPMISYTQWDSRVKLSQLVIHSISSRTLCSPKPITQPRPKRLLELVTINHMWRHHIICIVELPILDQDPSTIYRVMQFQFIWDLILITLEPIMPWHMSWFWVLKWGGMSGLNKRLWWILNISNTFKPTFGLKNPQKNSI